MNRVRPIEVVTCCICGREFDKIRTKEIFTGRVKYMCLECDANANKQIAGVKEAWRKTPAGKAAIEKMNKRNRRK